MKKIAIALVLIFIIFIGAIISQILFKKSPSLLKQPFVTIKNHKFKLYVARDPKDYQIGLSKYNNLPQDYGMLFPFEKPDYYSFWMKQMKFPIDIIYIKDGKIVTIYKSVQPPKSENESLSIYKPREPSNMVLEINAGLTGKYNLKEGDKISLNNI